MLDRVLSTRIKLVAFLFLLGFFVVLARVVQLQIVEREYYVEKVIEKLPKASLIKIQTYRAAIKDRNGKILAVSVPTISIFAFPEHVQEKEELARRLSFIEGLREEDILKALNSNKKFVWLARNVDKSYINYIRKVIQDTSNTDAVGIQEDFKRYYPHGTMASNLLGFVGADGNGLEGLEYKFDNLLKGKEIKKLVYVGRLSYEPVDLQDTLKPDLQITLDFGLQTIVENIRDSIVQKWKPRRVAIMVMDLQNGDILAMTTYPYYNPNEFDKVPDSYRKNYVVTDLFEPGSVMKPFFIGMALDRRYVSENFGVDTSRGKIEVYGRYVKDVHPSGYLTLDKILIKSSNIGTISVARSLSSKDVEELLEKFHLTQTFGILPGEAKPRLPSFKYPANILYASIGQGLSFNLLNICVAFGGLATNRIVKPRILLSDRPEVLSQNMFKEETLRWLHRTLIRVVEEGTATLARSDYFTIAGKTGTSQKFDFRLNMYSREKVVTYFVGYFPATAPRFVAGILVDEPKGEGVYGGTVAAPYFKELVERTAFYYRLEPDKRGQRFSYIGRKE
ncbi:peptidoglycan D,D-transpeptidase FtsI family protein [Thermocrinis minervae]|uniref:Cell division protein FtsI (Penicillin-binding protein 3) n=1 Tax=Thermocrinis minervae TaxID=381751 RepID=A0A1M6TE15_9AQUI|nr:penicillin-binding protein 2 [Thermocrinis minervae]SHK55139.1 cell division protein FtsI (penicillin-binding protein 3) [Thermocrinis minervae]